MKYQIKHLALARQMRGICSSPSSFFQSARHLRLSVIALSLAGVSSQSALAATYYWDLNGDTANTGTSASGTWDGSAILWNTSSSGGNGTNRATTSNGDDLIFSSGSNFTSGGSITLSGARVASSITFEENAIYTLSGGTSLTLGGTGTSDGIFLTSAADSDVSISTALILNGSNTFQTEGTGVLTLSGGVTGTGNLNLKNNSTNAAGITISTVSLNNTGTVTNSGSGSGGVLISSVIGTNVTGVIQNSATSTLTLSGSNLYTGLTDIQAGTLTLGANDVLANASTIKVSGGILSQNTRTDTVAGVQLTAGSITGTTGVLTSTTAFDLQAGSVTAILGGSVGVNKTTSGTVTLSGANTYTGLTTITTGALQANDGTGLPTGSFLSLNGGVLQSDGIASFTRSLGTSGSSKFQWTSNGGGFSANGGKMTVTIANNAATELVWGTTVGSQIVGTLDFGSTTANAETEFQNKIDLGSATRTVDVASGTGGDFATLSGVIRGTGNLTKTGAGKLVLSGNNSYNGVTTVSAGTLRATTSANALGLGTLTLSGGILELANDTGLNLGRNTSVTSSSTIKSDVLTSGAAGVTHTLGTLSMTSGQTLSVAAGPNVAANSDYGLTFGATSTTGNNAVFDVANNGTGIGTLTLGVLSGDDDWLKTGVGTMVLNTESTNTGSIVTLAAGTLKLGNTTALGNTTTVDLLLNGGMLDLATDASVYAYDTTVDGTVTIASNKGTSSSTGITHTLGTLTLTSGTINIMAGSNVTSGTAGLTFGAVTSASNSNIIAPGAGTLVTVASLGTAGTNRAYTIDGAGDMTVNGTVITGNRPLIKSGTGTLTLSGAGTSTANENAGANRNWQVLGGVLKLSHATALPGGITSTATGGAGLTLNGGVVGLANGDFSRVLGASSVTAASSQVQFTGSGGFAAYTADRNVNLGGSVTPATVTWNTGSFVPTGSALILGAADADKTVNFQNPIALVNSARTVQVDNGSADVDGILSGVVSSSGTSGGLTKTGAGTLTLTNANSYTGITSVNAGTLIVNGDQSTATGAMSVASVAALLGTGTIGGATTILGTHSSGASAGAVGTQNFSSSLTYSSGSIFAWDLNVSGLSETHDKVVAGSLLGSGAEFKIVGSGDDYATAFWDSTRNWTATDLFGASNATVNLSTIFSSANTTTNFNANSLQGLFSFTDTGGGTGNQLTWTAVPEPTSALAGILLGAGLLRRRRTC